MHTTAQENPMHEAYMAGYDVTGLLRQSITTIFESEGRSAERWSGSANYRAIMTAHDSLISTKVGHWWVDCEKTTSRNSPEPSFSKFDNGPSLELTCSEISSGGGQIIFYWFERLNTVF